MIGQISQTKYIHSIRLNIHLLGIFFISLLFAMIAVYKINLTQLFYSYDPYYHYHITKYWEIFHPFSSEAIGYGGNSLKFDYPTLFRPLTLIFSIFSGVDLLIIYKISGVFLRLVAGLSLYSLLNNLTQSKLLSLIVFIIFLFTPYLFLRSLISYPENMVLIFHILILNSAVKTLRTKYIHYSMFVFWGFSLLVHFRSAIFPTFAILITMIFQLVYSIKNKLFIKYIVNSLIGLAIGVVISLPVMIPLVSTYVKYASENVGANATLKERYGDTPQYAAPSYNFYEEQLGKLIIPIYLILFLFIYKTNSKNYYLHPSILFFMMTILGLLFTRGKQLYLYIPPLRMFSYLTVSFLPLLAIAFMGFRKYFGRYIFLFVSICLILAFIINTLPINGWVGLKKEDIAMGYNLNPQLSAKSVVIWNDINPINLGISKYENIEPSWDKNQLLLHYANTDLKLFYRELVNNYPNSEVYIMTQDTLNGLKIKDQTQLLNIYYVNVNSI